MRFFDLMIMTQHILVVGMGIETFFVCQIDLVLPRVQAKRW